MRARDNPTPEARIVRPWPSRKNTLPLHCRRLGIIEINAIDLRHTALSWAVRKRGIRPASCAFAGHSSPTEMARTYAHSLPIEETEVIEDLESIVEEVKPQK
jgi:integrase